MHISVVICTRNRPDLIGQAVDSVLENTYPNFDVIVVDQSDDERTGDIVCAIGALDGRLRYLHTNIAGLSRAYNLGIKETFGELLAFTDDDCVAPSNWLQTIVNAFQQQLDGDLLYGQVVVPSRLADQAAQI